MAGIDQIRFYTPGYYLDLKTLAAARGVDPAKFCLGLGQEKMTICPPDEDVVTMAASAAKACLADYAPEEFGLLLFATESGVDQSKAAAVYLHRLLGLPSSCQALELKQACCSSSFGLQLALDRVRLQPDRKVLLVAADIARYGLATPGEATQGAAAAAIVIGAEPRLLAIDPVFGSYTEDVMDFWRPNYRTEACVDGKFSIRMYLKAMAGAWEDFRRRGGHEIHEFRRFCYHQPFTKMAHKAHSRLLELAGGSADAARAEVEPGLFYNRRIGNSYTASLIISVASMLEQETVDLADQRLACFGYGSGCTALWFGARGQPGYREILARDAHEALLRRRIELSVAEYERLHSYSLPSDGSAQETPVYTSGEFRLAGCEDHRRVYHHIPPGLAATADGRVADVVA